MNGPLAKAINGAKEAVPGAPGLFIWKKNANGIWEFGMSQGDQGRAGPLHNDPDGRVMRPASVATRKPPTR